MKKNLLFAMGMLLVSIAADAEPQFLTVEKKNGVKFSFKLENLPVLTHDRGSLIVDGNQSTSYAIAGVNRYYFTEKDLTAAELETNDVLCFVPFDENTIQIRVQNASAGVKVDLVNVGGTLLSSVLTDQNGVALLSLPSQKGVYVVSVGKKSFKLIRK